MKLTVNAESVLSYTILVMSAVLLTLLVLSPATASAAGNASHGAIVATGDGYIVAGKVTYEYGSELYLLKTDLNGSEVWHKTYGEYATIGDVFALTAVRDGYIIAGTTTYENGTGFYLLKTDLNGNTSWIKAYGGSDRYVKPYSVAVSDDGIVLTGTAGPYPRHENTFFAFSAVSHAFLIKIDSNGNVVWYQVYDGSNYDTGKSVAIAPDGYIISGNSVFKDLGGSYAFLIKTDKTGNQLWNCSLGWNMDRGEAVIAASGGYVVAGDTGYPYFGMSSVKVSLLKTDADGNRTWEKTYLIGQGFDATRSAIAATDGYLIAGTASITGDLNDHSYMLFLLKTDHNGSQAWNQTYPDLGMAAFSSVIPAADGYVIAGPVNLKGYWQGYDQSGAAGLRLLKTDLNGIVVWDRTYESLIVREKPVGYHGSPTVLVSSPVPLATPVSAPGISPLLSSLAIGIASLFLFIRVSPGKRR